MQKRYTLVAGDRVRRQTACGFRVGWVMLSTAQTLWVQWDDGEATREPPSTLEYYPTPEDVERRRNEIRDSWTAVQEQQRAGDYGRRPIDALEEMSTLRERRGRPGAFGV